MSTYFPKAGDAQEQWYVVDAKGEVVGRLAARVASVLRGKNDPTYHPAANPRNHVIVINADKAIFTGRKLKAKTYHSHSGYPGGYKSITADELARKKPTESLRLAIKGMLPKTRLGDVLLTHLRLVEGDQHPHAAQQPQAITLTKPRAKASSSQEASA